MFFLKSKLDALIMKYVFSKSEVETKKHFQHIVLFELYRVKALDAARAICVLYEEDTIGESTVRKWFFRFKVVYFDMNSSPRLERPSLFNNLEIVQYEGLWLGDICFPWQSDYSTSVVFSRYCSIRFPHLQLSLEQPSLMTTSCFKVNLVNSSLPNHGICSGEELKNCQIVRRQSQTLEENTFLISSCMKSIKSLRTYFSTNYFILGVFDLLFIEVYWTVSQIIKCTVHSIIL